MMILIHLLLFTHFDPQKNTEYFRLKIKAIITLTHLLLFTHFGPQTNTKYFR